MDEKNKIFAELIPLVKDTTRRYCKKHLTKIVRHQLEEDYYQIGLITAWDCLDSFDKSKLNLKGYVYTSVMNRCRNFARDNKSLHKFREEGFSQVEALGYNQPTPLFEFVDCLSAREKRIFQYIYIDKETYEEVQYLHGKKGRNARKVNKGIKEKMRQEYSLEDISETNKAS